MFTKRLISPEIQSGILSKMNDNEMNAAENSLIQFFEAFLISTRKNILISPNIRMLIHACKNVLPEEIKPGLLPNALCDGSFLPARHIPPTEFGE